MRPIFQLIQCGIMAAVLSTACGGASGAPQVVTTIAPVHSLAARVMAGVGMPDNLVPPGASPHSFALRPSDARLLERAKVVFWIGQSLEAFLPHALDTLARRARVVALAELPGVHRLPVRAGGVWDANVDPAAAGRPDRSAHDHPHEIDGHMWLDPENAAVWLAAMADILAGVDPAHAATYRANAAQGVVELGRLTRGIATAVAPVRERPYIVFHDAYQYFERRFGLNAVGAITVSPDQQPSAARIAEVRRRISERGVVCVFTEPQFEPRLARALVAGTPARLGVLDPEGADIALGPSLYPTLLTRLADGLSGCLR